MCKITSHSPKHCPKQVCLAQLQQVHFIGCRPEVHRQEVLQDVRLPLIEPDEKYSGLTCFLFKPLQNVTLCLFLGTPEWTWPESILPSI